MAAGPAGRARPAPAESRRAGAGLPGEGRVRPAHDACLARAAAGRCHPAAAVRLGTDRRGSQRGDLLAGVRGVRRERPADAPARGVGTGALGRARGGAYCAGFDRDPGARAAAAEGGPGAGEGRAGRADADRPRGPFAPEPAEVGPDQGETQPGREQERLGEARGSGQPPSRRGPGRAVWSGSVR